MTLSRKILLLAFILLPVLLVAFYSLYETRKQLIKRIYEERSTMASLASNVLKEKLDHLTDIGLSLATRPSLNDYVDDGNWQQAIRLMQSIPAAFPYIKQVLISDTAGNIKGGVPGISQGETTQQASFDWFKGVSKDWKSYLSEVYKASEGPQPIVSALAIPIKNSGGNIIGIIVLKVNLARLLEWSGDVSIGQAGNVYVIDQNGQVASSLSFLDYDSIIDYAKVPAVQRVLNGEKRVEVSFNPISKQNCLFAYQQVPRYKWAIVVQQETSAALPIFYSLRIVLLFYGLVILVAAALAIFIIYEIDRRKISEKHLRKSEETSRLLIDQSNDAIYGVDNEGRITSWNKGAQKIYGFTPCQAVGYDSNQLLQQSQMNEEVNFVKNTIDVKGYWVGELKGMTNSGQKICVRSSNTAIKDKYGIINGYVSVNIDITEELKLREQVNYLATLVNQSTDAIISVDMQGNIATWNKGSELLHGYTEQEVTGRRPSELKIHRLTTDEILKVYETVRLNGYWQKEMTLYRKDETSFFGVVNASPIKNQAGETTSFVFIEKDISLRKQLEKKLQRYNEELEKEILARVSEEVNKETRFRALIENNEGIIALLNEKLETIYRSPGSERITGWTPEERQLVGTGEYIHPDDLQYATEIIKKVLANPGQTYKISVRTKHRSGRYVWLEGTVKNMLPDSGIGAIIINLRDITEQKDAEEKIKKINSELEERVEIRTEQLKVTNDELEAFSYSVSHDLRAPLRAIIGFTSILEEEYVAQLDNEAKRLTAIIRSNAQHMGNLIDDLLTFSRMRLTNIVKSHIDTNALVEEIVSGYRNDTNAGTIEWVIPSLHPAMGDFNAMRQVWINLISNAIKYSGTRAKQRIEIKSYQRLKETVFEIKDNGVGFDQKYHHKLFKVFQRLHSVDEFEGTGVGLAIVEKIIYKHGGKIWAKGEVNHGATFYFTLPLSK